MDYDVREKKKNLKDEVPHLVVDRGTALSDWNPLIRKAEEQHRFGKICEISFWIR